MALKNVASTALFFVQDVSTGSGVIGLTSGNFTSIKLAQDNVLSAELNGTLIISGYGGGYYAFPTTAAQMNYGCILPIVISSGTYQGYGFPVYTEQGYLAATSGLAATASSTSITISGNLNSTSGDINTLRTNFATVSGYITTALPAYAPNASGGLQTLDGNLMPTIRRGIIGTYISTTSFNLDAGASSVDQFYTGAMIVAIGPSGYTGLGQCRIIRNYTGGTKNVTVDALSTAFVTSTTQYMILANANWISNNGNGVVNSVSTVTTTTTATTATNLTNWPTVVVPAAGLGSIAGAVLASGNNAAWSVTGVSGMLVLISGNLNTTNNTVNTISGIVTNDYNATVIASGQLNTISGNITTLQNNLATVSGLVYHNGTDVDYISGIIVINSGNLTTVMNNLITVSGNLYTTNNTVNTVSGNLNVVNNTLNTVSGNVTSLPNIATIVSSGNANSWNAVTSVAGISGQIANVDSDVAYVSGLINTLQNNLNTVSGITNNDYNATIVASGLLNTISGNINIVNNTLNTVSGNVALLPNITTIVNSGNAAGWNSVTAITTVTVSGITPTALSQIVSSGHADGWANVTAATDLSGISGSLNTISGNLDIVNTTLNNVSGQITLNNSIISTVSGKVDNTLTTLITVSGNLTNNPITVSGLTPQALSQIVTSGHADGWNTVTTVTTVTVSGITPDALSAIVISGNAQGWDGNLAIPEVSGDPGATPTLNQASMLKYMELRNARTQGDPTLPGQYYVIYKNDGTPLASGILVDSAISGIFIKGKLSF